MALLLLLSLLPPALPRPLPGPEPEPRRSSVLLDPASGQLQIVPRWDPAAVAWANLTDRIQDTG
ncbi:putative phospholipase B-like 2 [Platysternon megacephalum]|uniref:Putative phospholipase B-like 2 n=1 Tax=Platysternon megacephalum TaxID=55544 RepID=A0A4D9EA70_9SAUR|nr:putative phospholipase B-like 2 [Platysternon megacephalum]